MKRTPFPKLYASDGKVFHIVSGSHYEQQIGFCGELFTPVLLGEREEPTTVKPQIARICKNCCEEVRQVTAELKELQAQGWFNE